jgi:hypothetical protein
MMRLNARKLLLASAAAMQACSWTETDLPNCESKLGATGEVEKRGGEK